MKAGDPVQILSVEEQGQGNRGWCPSIRMFYHDEAQCLPQRRKKMLLKSHPNHKGDRLIRESPAITVPATMRKFV